MALLVLPSDGNDPKNPVEKWFAEIMPSAGLKAPMLQRNDLHVWSADLDETIPCAEALLSMEELEKAARFKFAEHRLRFIHGRAILRMLLGHYLGRAPQEVQIHYGPAGKPMVESSLSFNLAHSGPMAIFGFSFEVALGIDVERIHQMPEMSGVAKIFFSEQEYDSWKNLPATEQETAFFNCWTRKEAFVKATGVGISAMLKDFVVTFEPNTPPELVQLETKHGRKDDWKLISLEPAKGYAAAIAIANREAKPSSWRFRVSLLTAFASA